jgi:tetratricopeptide (TPR) repeat protein
MPKSFLCHSSADKDFVGVVARQLGRAKVHYDEFVFEPGADFRDEIRRHLHTSSVFTFFVSRESLASVWCRFELDSAELRRMQGGIKGQLALIIDPSVSFSDLPPWMQGARAIALPSPRRATREVEHALLAQLGTDLKKPFIGRQADLAAFARGLVPYGDPGPHILIASGLEGVGRRSLLERGVSDNLGLRWGPTFAMTHTSDMTDMYLWLVDETGSLDSRRHLVEEAHAFRQLEQEFRTKELLARLLALCEEQTVPCIIDEGGLLHSNGTYIDDFSAVLTAFIAGAEDRYLSILHRRRPYLTQSLSSAALLTRVDALAADDMRLLLSALLRREGQTVSEEQSKELVEYLDGYPPAAYFVVSLIKEYGPDALLADKRALEDFKARRFERFLQELELSEGSWLLLRYLAAEPPLPLAAVAVALDIPVEDVGASLQALIDLSLVARAASNYTVAGPIRTSVSRLGGLIPREDYKHIAARLREAYWVDDKVPTLEVIDATLRATAFAGEVKDAIFDEVAGARVSTVQKIADTSYHNKDFEAALDYARRAQRLDPTRRGLSETIFKALVRLEKWEEAAAELEAIRTSGNPRYHFLNGFGLRRRGEIAPAAAAFSAALDAGDTSLSTHRELAFCYYALSNYDSANRECAISLQRDATNLYILDLACLVHLARRDFVAADESLRRLETVDVLQRFVNHRRATYWMKQKNFANALNFAEQAVVGGHAPFEARAQKVDILIEMGDHEGAAAALQDLVTRFPRERHDVRVGLRCKALARRGRWRDGLELWNQLREKNRPVHQGLKKALLVLKSRDTTLTLVERERASQEADAIAADLDVMEDLGSLLDPPDTDV